MTLVFIKMYAQTNFFCENCDVKKGGRGGFSLMSKNVKCTKIRLEMLP